MPAATTGISYHSEPMRNRMPLSHNPADSGEDISMSSWVYGDPAPPILKAYVGDPAKIRLIHGSIKETHVFHLHNHQWCLESDNQNSTIIDSISISPQEYYTLDILHGAGSLNGMIGDAIFHCHLYPHFHEGMWTLWRIYDRLQDGSRCLPDGTPIPPLLPLQPPPGILDADGNNKIEPTDLELDNFVQDFKPGSLYTDTCPCHADEMCDCPCHADAKQHQAMPDPLEENLPVKVFEIALVQAKLTYNRHDGLDAYTV